MSVPIKLSASNSPAIIPIARPSATLALMAIAALAAGCGSNGSDPEILPGDQANARVSITNDQPTLDQRITDLDENVVIDEPAPPAVPVSEGPATALAKGPDSIVLTLVREIAPPVVEGELVQATSVSMRSGDKAIVSYNMAGALSLGAMDYFKKLDDKKAPELKSSVAFNDSDINAVDTEGKWVYAIGATTDPALPFPAFLERYQIKSDKLILDDSGRIGLISFAATSATVSKDVVYATSGNTGEIAGFDEKDLEPLGSFPLNDARWVAWDEKNERMVVAQGMPGQLSIFEQDEFPGGSMNLLNSFSFPGANVAEAKTTVEIAGGKAFIAAGDEGVQIMCVDTGLIIGSVPRPDPEELELDPAVVVTNAVTVDKDLLFISNGGAGVYVAQSDGEDFTNDNCDTQEITLLGRLRFDGLESVNHVAYKGDYLFVAAGLGGVKVVRVDQAD